MAEIDRLSQYRYLIRAMQLEDKRSLEAARAIFSRDGINVFDDDLVFLDARNNDDFVTITRAFFKSVTDCKVPGRRRFDNILEQYLAIVVEDREDCCGMDRKLVLADGELATA